jgi:hypothetical protein
MSLNFLKHQLGLLDHYVRQPDKTQDAFSLQLSTIEMTTSSKTSYNEHIFNKKIKLQLLHKRENFTSL